MRSDSALLENYLHDALTILGASLSLAQAELPVFYRVVAVQLRLLLCDTTRRHGEIVDISLLAGLRPGMRLRSLDRAREPMPLADWLEQRLPLFETNESGQGAQITARTLIRRVCEQDGGAHVDPRPAAGLPAGEYREWILRIAQEVLASTQGRE